MVGFGLCQVCLKTGPKNFYEQPIYIRNARAILDLYFGDVKISECIHVFVKAEHSLLALQSIKHLDVGGWHRDDSIDVADSLGGSVCNPCAPRQPC